MQMPDDTLPPPVAGQNTWGLDADDVNPATWITVPEAWKNAELEFHADGETFAFTFGGAGLTTVARTAKSTITANAIGAQGSVGYVLSAGQRVRVKLWRVHPDFKVRLAVFALTGTPGNMLRVTSISGRLEKV